MRGITRLFRSSSFLFAAVFSTLFAIVTAVWAVDELGIFELEGDAKGASPVMMIPDDWEEVFDGDDAADVSVFISSADEDPSVDISYFTGGGSKDVRDVSEWQSTENNVAPDKDQILDAFAAAYINPSDYPAAGPVVHDAGDRLLFFGLDRFAVSGDAQVGFWFLKGQVSVDIDGDPNTADPFIGNHQVGDILVLSDFVKGGKVSEIRVFEWVGGNQPLQMLGSGGDCGDAHDFACATVNNPGDDSGSPWPFVPKAGSAGTFPDGAFFEGGINLTKLGVEEGCFNTFIAETRSSQSVTAQLKDYALGAFPLCHADVATEVHDKDHNDITFATDVLVLTDVHDKAFVTGSGVTNPPDPTGNVSFQLYTGLDCMPGNESGSAEVVGLGAGNPATAESTPFTPAAGEWSFSVSYAGDGNYPSAMLPGEHCEPFTVIKRDATVVTNIHDSGHNDITGGSAFVGETVHDKAFVNGDGVAPTPTGNVTFYRYATGNCSGSPMTEVKAMSGGTAESSNVLLSASGGLSYLATYSGDQYYNEIKLADLDKRLVSAGGHCEPLTVNKRVPNIVTFIHAGPTVGPAHVATDIKGGSIDVGDTVHDQAAVSGAGNTPTGTVTFYRYSTANCTGTPLPQAGVNLVGGKAESSAFTATTSGGLSYLAAYSGDTEYFPITLQQLQQDLQTHCEPLTVNKVQANIATNIHAGPTVGPAHVATDIQGGSVNAGDTVHDKATVSGAQGTPTGTVTFYRYSTGNCMGTPMSETNVSLVGGMAESTAFTTSTSGGLSYLATYSGDGVYFPITLNQVRADLINHCEPLTVNKLDANIATNIHAGTRVGPGHVDTDIQGGQVNVGTVIHDKATVSGVLSTPTGSVTFHRYATLDCSGGAVSDGPWTLSGGTQESGNFTTVIGALSYLATYSGDSVYNPITLGDLAGNLPAHCEPLTVVGVFEACTPGYWKQPQHFGNWAAPYSPVPVETVYVDVFGVGGNLPGLPGKYKNITLLGALEADGNTDHEALLRHSAAALLNTANSNVNYPLSTQEVINLVRSAFATGTAAAAHAELAGYNETFDCPLARADL